MKKQQPRPGKPRRKYTFPIITERFLPHVFKLRKKLRWAAAALVLFGVIVGGTLLYLRMQALPAASISQTSQMLDLQGQIIDTFHSGENRRSVPLAEVSKYVVDATLAIEDRRFYEHNGFDIKGLARAVVVNVETLSAKQGASTLTQQLARNLYLTHEKTWQRKMKEAMYTVQLEMHYSKDEILGLYLNQIYYGHGAYGIEAAAQLYFNKKASELTLAESAMLAGIPKGPKYYSPFMDMKNAKDRQHVILRAMAKAGDITEAEADAAYQEMLTFQPLGSGEQAGFAPYFRDYIRYIAVDKLGINEQLLNEGGITIYTTLDPVAQQAAEDAVKQGLAGSEEQQAALISIDPRNGYIKAMVGGRDYKKNQFNRTLVETRQPGSSFKPILYLTALQSGFMTPVSRFKSEPTSFTYDEGRKVYEPRNYNEKYFNDFIDMRTAIASSDNIYAVNSIMTVGADRVIETARKLGITSPMNPVPSLALGTFPVSPMQMASAFSAIANGGVRVEPIAILRITDRSGKVLYEAERKEEQVVDPAYAYVMTSLMESVFEGGGTANRVSSLIKRPVAGKTGTTSTDAWLVGYTPELATAVWVGYDKDRKLTVAEAHRAAPIFARYTEQALAAVPPKIFPIPAGVVNVYIDPASGKLAAANCPSKRLESFVSGTEPVEVCGDPAAAGEGAAGADGADGASGEEAGKHSWWNDLKRWWKD
ncbi:transglycosylase domain-containing protein [Paenibacillus sp. NEAU-GSW1]|uniref:transglycosylase domain-containing protein n=1 Tax=Paenibacillus sp. NEAU-GSW1 TaxID=2682486 RepID=UPI0012E110D3|nr:PBP1A family penicillin-binding protein [Paenibacillus sp. NEAU-GSW1]MUT67896.1 PBP1A family penicillin-binding protein [Paenibacillus sp. NEAU-GSW1]